MLLTPDRSSGRFPPSSLIARSGFFFVRVRGFENLILPGKALTSFMLIRRALNLSCLKANPHY